MADHLKADGGVDGSQSAPETEPRTDVELEPRDADQVTGGGGGVPGSPRKASIRDGTSNTIMFGS